MVAKATILLPVHNDERFLSFTLKSLLDQTFSDFKCFIGFNGTVDSSREISRNILKKDPRFEIIDFGQESGKSITLNKLLEKVDTDFICLIDGDDIWHPRKLESQIGISSEFDVIGTFCHYIDENNNITNTLNLSHSDLEIKRWFTQGHNQIINSSSFFKTSDAKKVLGWDPNFEGLEDFDFWLKLFMAQKNFHNISRPLVYHRVHKNSNFNSKILPYTVQDLLIKNKINADTTF
jgi:glycosyltransferase involved in cell wall biosynthesis